VRALTVSAILFGVLVAFGLGILVGRFVLGDQQTIPAETVLPPLPGEASGAGLAQDAVPVGALPSPPASVVLPSDLAASSAVNAALASSETAACDIRIARGMPLRSFAKPDRMVIQSQGEDCTSAVVTLSIQDSGGSPLYSFSAPASALGFAGNAGETKESLMGFLNRYAPTTARSSARLPVWAEGSEGPALPNGVSLLAERPFYEAIRAQSAPLFCHRASTRLTKCFAADPEDGLVKPVTQEGN
jgi:hypothetical protein